jgi:hypothetical protein
MENTMTSPTDTSAPAGTASIEADRQPGGPASANSEHREAGNGGIRTASTVAGVALLLVALLAAFGEFAVVERLVVDSSRARTATNIAGSESLFRLGIASLLTVAGLGVIVAWGLYRVFKPVSNNLSLLAAWLRVAYAAIFAVAIAQLAGVLHLLPDANAQSGQILTQVQAYKDIWNAGLLLFGLHLIVLGVLAWRASYAPAILGALLVVAGLGYAIDAFGTVLFAGYHANVATFTFLGEVVLIAWLLVKGRRLAVS